MAIKPPFVKVPVPGLPLSIGKGVPMPKVSASEPPSAKHSGVKGPQVKPIEENVSGIVKPPKPKTRGKIEDDLAQILGDKLAASDLKKRKKF